MSGPRRQDRRPPPRTGRPRAATDRREPPGLAARHAAWTVLRGVAEQDAYANLALPAILRERRLSSRDAALATALTYGTLRSRATLDAVLAACVDRRPFDEVDAPVLDVLRLGAFALLVLRQSPHAAVSVTVGLADRVAGIGAAGFVNAVLRRVSEADLDTWLTRVVPPDADPIARLALVHSHPPWVIAALRDALVGPSVRTPEAFAELERLLVVDNAAPPVTLAARPGALDPADLLAEAAALRPVAESAAAPDTPSDTEPGTAHRTGGGESPVRTPDAAGPTPAGPTLGRWSPVAVRLAGGDPGRLPAVRSGLARVQDEGSQLVALALAAAPTAGPDTGWWLDLCAGPGGKAALLTGTAAAVGARVLATDIAPHRARLVRAALAGPGGPGNPAGAVAVVDATAPAWPDAAFDRVLLDAPCTGLGAIRRRPEARWRRTPADVSQLRVLQRALLAAAVRAVRPGGVLAYATCSPHLAETRTVVTDGIRDAQRVGIGLTRLRTPTVLPVGLELPVERTDAQLWPHRHDTDAMYLALLRRHD